MIWKEKRIDMDWILSVTTLIGLWLVGNKDNRGNIILVVNQGLWAWFAVSTNNKGLLPLVIALFFLYSRNCYRWYGEGRLLSGSK